MTFYFVIFGYGLTFQVWVRDAISIGQVIFGFALIRGWTTYRSERWMWNNEYGTATLSFERTRDDVRVDGWYLRGPLIRTVVR